MMLDKIAAWCCNLLVTSTLLLVVLTSPSVLAQQDGAADENGSGKIKVPLTGTAAVKLIDNLSVSPPSFDSGLTEVGSLSTQSVTLSHTGAVESDPIVIESATIFGKNAHEYSTGFNGFVTLFPGESMDIEVTFSPVESGIKSAGLRLDIQDGTAPFIIFFNGWSRFPLTSDLGFSDNVVQFGEVVEGSTITKTFVLTNLGESEAPSITVSDIQLSGDTPEAFSVDFTPMQLAPGETQEVAVQLSSPNHGFKSADVVVIHDGYNPTVEFDFAGEVIEPDAAPVNFGFDTLIISQLARPTALQFGPDDRLYITEMNGKIKVFDITRNGANDYTATTSETITTLLDVQNHNDDGSVNNSLNQRLITGMVVTGTASSPMIYIASSDPRQAAGPSGTDSGLDTNSGILHRLTKNGNNWTREDLVRGLPRSEENHVPNGLVLDGDKIFLLTGGHTNMGVPSNNFALLPEYALSAALLEIDLSAIGSSTYDLPTLDDEDRTGSWIRTDRSKCTQPVCATPSIW